MSEWYIPDSNQITQWGGLKGGAQSCSSFPLSLHNLKHAASSWDIVILLKPSKGATNYGQQQSSAVLNLFG